MANAKYDVKALREKVMASDDIKYDEVYVEEWDVKLPVKTLSSAELKEVMSNKSEGEIRMMNVAVIYGCKTKSGESVFTREDLAKFEAEKSFGAISKVAERIFELSGFSEKADAEVKKP